MAGTPAKGAKFLTRSGLTPGDADEPQRRRLGVAAGVAAAAFATLIVSGLASRAGGVPELARLAPGAFPVGIATTALATALALGARRLRGAMLAPAAVALAVGAAAAVALVEAHKRVPESAMGTSLVAIWIALFPLFVPHRRVVVTAMLAASAGPVAALVATLLGRPLGATAATVGFFIPNYAAAIIAVVVDRSLGRAEREAATLGSYRLVEKIGGGGMGEVWRAEHRLLAQPAAAKIIRPDMLGGPDRDVLLKRFEMEARITARLTSPHTVRLYDYGVTSTGALYYVMELLDGMDLQAMVQRFGPLDPERAVDFLAQACDALAEAHAEGLIHRDIKPSNLVACRAGQDRDFLKVLDFGLVKPPRQTGIDLTQSGMLMGSPGYVAPEMALGRPTDARADLYSLGCVGYYLLAGCEVFDIHAPMAALKDHAYKQPTRPSERAGRPLPAELEEVVLACLAKDPDARPDGAEALARRLRACLPRRWSQERARRWWAEHGP
ncbi:MAG TPA: serine/threonine-protein kinase [Haliangiales bacterium]|nr:serine/threonine-protein kinase [Haliangiales bacterium]